MLLECLFQPFVPGEVGFCCCHLCAPVTLKGSKSCRGLVTAEQNVGAERSDCSSSTWQKAIQHPAKHRQTWKDYALPTERAKDKLPAY